MLEEWLIFEVIGNVTCHLGDSKHTCSQQSTALSAWSNNESQCRERTVCRINHFPLCCWLSCTYQVCINAQKFVNTKRVAQYRLHNITLVCCSSAESTSWAVEETYFTISLQWTAGHIYRYNNNTGSLTVLEIYSLLGIAWQCSTICR